MLTHTYTAIDVIFIDPRLQNPEAWVPNLGVGARA